MCHHFTSHGQETSVLCCFHAHIRTLAKRWDNIVKVSPIFRQCYKNYSGSFADDILLTVHSHTSRSCWKQTLVQRCHGVVRLPKPLVYDRSKLCFCGHTITEQFVCAKHKHAIVDETKRRLALRVKGR